MLPRTSVFRGKLIIDNESVRNEENQHKNNKDVVLIIRPMGDDGQIYHLTFSL